MKEYLVKVRNGGCSESELTDLFNKLSREGWTFDKISCSGNDNLFGQRVYIIFYRLR